MKLELKRAPVEDPDGEILSHTTHIQIGHPRIVAWRVQGQPPIMIFWRYRRRWPPWPKE